MSRKVLFYHIPKTAGTTFVGILLKQFKSEKVFNVNAGSIHSAKRYYELTNEILLGLDNRIVANSDLIYGHMPFVTNDKYVPFQAITFLRDPVKRVVSDYLYTRSTPQNPLHHILQDLTLKEYVSQHGDLHLDNLQTRIISGKISGALDASDVEMAEHNLFNRFKFYGITEYFDYSLVLLNQVLGWQVSSYAIRNVTKSGNNNIREDDLDAVKQYNQFDLRLYERATSAFMGLIDEKRSFFEKEAKTINKMDKASKPVHSRSFLSRLRKLLG